MRAIRGVPTIVLCLALCASAWATVEQRSDPPFTPEYEKRIGAEAAAQVEAEYNRLEDEEKEAELQAMVVEIAAATPRSDVQYDVRLLDTDMANAFSLPGGIIYVTKGLFGAVQSEHELAGVLAHEIAHNCTYDALEQAERNQELFTGGIAMAIATILAGADSDMVSTVFMASEYARRGVLGGYSIRMEERADANAVEFLCRTSYNPVGLLTFMERLAADQRREPQAEMGVFQTHPLSTERVEALARRLYAHGIDINRRATTEWEHPVAEQVEPENGEPYVHVSLWGTEIVRVLAAGPDHDTPMARAEGIVSRLTELLADGLSSHEVAISDAGDPAISARDTTIMTVLPGDAEGRGLSQQELAEKVLTNLRLAFRKERLNRLY